MRSSRVIALVVVAIATTASFAGAQASAPGAARAPRAGRSMAAGIQGRAGAAGLLRGVTLSAAEKTKIKQVHASYRTESKPLRESLRPAMLEAKAARQKGDTVAARTVLQRTKSDREKLQALTERQKSDTRAALSPEHQKQFDANVQQLAQQRAHGRKGGKSGKGLVREHMGRRSRPGTNG